MGKKSRSDIQLPKTGPLAFDSFYREMIGDRWAHLQDSCRQAARHFKLSQGLVQPYYLDPASVFAALQLDIQSGQSVLDLCAAPGGKSLVLAQQLFGLVPQGPNMDSLGSLMAAPSPDAFENDSDSESALEAFRPENPKVQTALPSEEAESIAVSDSRLLANERSATRRGRLRQVLASHLPQYCLPAISISAHDATAWGQYQQAAQDRILLDVPCSSERHLIQAPNYLKDWSPGRTKQLAQQAYAMGLSAGRALKDDGLLLYCTCALSTQENDETIQRILERSHSQAPRYGYRLELDDQFLIGTNPPDYLVVERTACGAQIWPDQGDAFGPLYFSRIKKVSNSKVYAC